MRCVDRGCRAVARSEGEWDAGLHFWQRAERVEKGPASAEQNAIVPDSLSTKHTARAVDCSMFRQILDRWWLHVEPALLCVLHYTLHVRDIYFAEGNISDTSGRYLYLYCISASGRANRSCSR